MTITLTTPTGNIGSKVLRHLFEDAPETTRLRVIARNPGKLPEDILRRIEVIQGDSNDPAVLRSALSGASALFWCQPDTPGAPDYVKAYEEWSQLARAAIDETGVPRVVAIAAAGEKPSRPAGPITALHRLEEIIGQSKASCRILRCGSFFSNILWQWESIMRDGAFYYSMPADSPGPQVATEDIARVAAQCLLDADWRDKEVIPLPGPADLSYDQMAAQLSQHLNRPVRYENLPADAYVASMTAMGLSASAAHGLVDMLSYLAEDYREDANADHSLTPTTFEQWLRKNLPS